MTADNMSHEGSNTRRLDRVETEVSEIRSGLTELRTELRGLGQFMSRIERALESRDAQEVVERQASRPNIIAIAAVLFSIVSALIGGAWIVGGQTARFDERDHQRDREVARIVRELDRVEARQWQQVTQ